MGRSTLSPFRSKKRLALGAAALAFTVAAIVSSGGPGQQAGIIPLPHIAPKCAVPDVTVWAQFRSHVLLPHDVVGTIIDGRPTWRGMTRDGNVFYRNGRAVLRVVRHLHPGRTRVVVTALAPIWLQEPGLVVKIAGEGVWQAFGPSYVSRRYALLNDDAYRSTVHFSRIPGPRYVQRVEYRSGAACLTLYSDGGFERLLDHPAPTRGPPWQGAEVFGEGYDLVGTHPEPNEVLRRWELAGGKWSGGAAQMYFLGWTGGPGAVVNASGRTPPPGYDVTAADGYAYLWQPRSWRELRPRQQIAQTLYVAAS